MSIEIQSFEEALVRAYIEAPCGTQANALWKTIKGLKGFNTHHEVRDNIVQKLEIYNDSALLLYWDRGSDEMNFTRRKIEELSFILIHDKYLKDIDQTLFQAKTPYFRIIHRNQDINKVVLAENYEIIDVDTEMELEEVSRFICKCYEDLKPRPEEVKKWTEHPVFEKSLWIWVMDKRENTPVALGIAEIDKSIPEGSLDWIQVLPEYHGKGLGQAIVNELLFRLKGRVNFTTVSGRVDNLTNPERLYRKCGFEGNDIWWVLRQ